MLPTIWQVVLVGIVSAGANGAGIWLVRRDVDATKRRARDLMALSAGVLIGGALLHVLPELAVHEPTALPWAAASFFSLYVVEHHFAPHFHVTPAEHAHGFRSEAGLAVLVGFAFHALFDGLAIGAGFAYGGGLGWIAALAVLAHEVPEGIATFTALVHSGHAPRRASSLSLIVALITPIAALLTFWLAASITAGAHGVLMALAGGSLLYIGAADLLPEAAHAKGWRKTFLIALGLGGMWALTLLGHAH